MKCPKCQFENREGATFCGKCGAGFSLVCPKCNSENPPENNFCDKCGYNLAESKEAPPIDYSEPQSYTPKHLADKILTTRSSIEGERKLVTVFFADVANYTSISEKLDPEEVHQIMDGCFKILMDEIHKYEGTINQFTGDGVMALFGAPVAHEDHVNRACYAALAVQKTMEEYGEKIKKDIGVDFKMRIGLNSGHVIVGSIGDDLRMDYTAVGDTTNLAARMESEANPGTILVSENTQKIARNYFEFESIGKLEVKGKEKPQEAYKIIKAGEIETRIGASIAKGLTRFVGRKNSMSLFMEAYDKVQSGSGQVVAVVGEAGVGKSRLLLEFRNSLPQGEFTYLEGRCLHFGGSMSYLPFKDILKSYFDIKEHDREYIVKKKIKDRIFDLDKNLEHVLPCFQEILSVKVEDEQYVKHGPEIRKILILEAIRDLFIRISQDKPFVLTIEDLHWIDRVSEEFLDYFIGWLANTKILLIVLYRPEYTHQWGSRTYYNRIGLDHLGIESSAALVRALLEGGDVAPELRDLILDRSGGNPLFMEEFTQTLLENGSIEKIDKQYILSQNISNIQVPETIQGIISARIDRLEDNLKRTMQVASVIGRDFAFRILQTITGMREELKYYLVNLQGLEFIYEKNLFPELEYIFKHALIQEVAYNSLLVAKRKEIHEEIGKAIEALYSERREEFYEMLAYHFLKAENWEKSAEYTKLSAEKAENAEAYFDAISFGEQRIHSLEQLPETDENQIKIIDARVDLSRYCEMTNLAAKAKEVIDPIAEYIDEHNNKHHLPRKYLVFGSYEFQVTEDIAKGQQLLEKALRIAREINDIYTEWVSQYFLGVFLSLNGNLSESFNHHNRLLELTKSWNWQYNIPWMRAHIGRFYYFSKGEMDLAVQSCSEALQEAIDCDTIPERYIGAIQTCYGESLFGRGQLVEAEKELLASLEITEKTKFHAWAGAACLALGRLNSELGDYSKSKYYYDHAADLYEKAKYIPSVTRCAKCGSIKAKFYIDNKYTGRLEEMTDLYKEIKYPSLKSVCANMIGEIFLSMDELKLDDSEKWILKAIEINSQNGFNFNLGKDYTLYAELFKRKGDQSKAKENLNKAIDILKECGADGWVAKYEKELAAIS